MTRAPAANIPRRPDRQNSRRARQNRSVDPNSGLLESYVFPILEDQHLGPMPNPPTLSACVRDLSVQVVISVI
eukprot:925983-Pyramimonas_sp.AAC.1